MSPGCPLCPRSPRRAAGARQNKPERFERSSQAIPVFLLSLLFQADTARQTRVDKTQKVTTTSSAVGSRPSTALKVGIRIHARAQPVRYKKHRGQCVMGARARQPPPVRVPYHRPTRFCIFQREKKVAKNEREPITGTDIPTEPALNEPIRDRTESHQSNLLLILARFAVVHAKLFSQKRNVTSLCGASRPCLWSFTTL